MPRRLNVAGARAQKITEPAMHRFEVKSLQPFSHRSSKGMARPGDPIPELRTLCAWFSGRLFRMWHRLCGAWVPLRRCGGAGVAMSRPRNVPEP